MRRPAEPDSIKETLTKALGWKCHRQDCGYVAPEWIHQTLSIREKVSGTESTGRPTGMNYHQFMAAVQNSVLKGEERFVLWCMNCVCRYNAALELKVALQATRGKTTRLWESAMIPKLATKVDHEFLNKKLALGETIIVRCSREKDLKVYAYRGRGLVLAETLEEYCEENGLVYHMSGDGSGDENLYLPKEVEEVGL